MISSEGLILYRIVLGCTSPQILRHPLALSQPLEKSVGPQEISWSSRLNNPIEYIAPLGTVRIPYNLGLINRVTAIT